MTPQSDLITLPRPENEGSKPKVSPDCTKCSWPEGCEAARREDFESLLEQAACRGARKALQQVGLHDENAAQDIRDLRDVLAAMRTARNEAFRTFIRWLTLGLLALLMAGIAAKSGFIGPR